MKYLQYIYGVALMVAIAGELVVLPIVLLGGDPLLLFLPLLPVLVGLFALTAEMTFDP